MYTLYRRGIHHSRNAFWMPYTNQKLPRRDPRLQLVRANLLLVRAASSRRNLFCTYCFAFSCCLVRATFFPCLASFKAWFHTFSKASNALHRSLHWSFQTLKHHIVRHILTVLLQSTRQCMFDYMLKVNVIVKSFGTFFNKKWRQMLGHVEEQQKIFQSQLNFTNVWPWALFFCGGLRWDGSIV